MRGSLTGKRGVSLVRGSLIWKRGVSLARGSLTWKYDREGFRRSGVERGVIFHQGVLQYPCAMLMNVDAEVKIPLEPENLLVFSSFGHYHC